MDYRELGRTGLHVSVLGFGCGAVGGLMIRGTEAERDRSVARAVELGINYFDTAPSYGAGLSERHLGQALRTLGSQVYVGTKFRLEPEDMRQVGPAVTRSLERSLERLGLERVDLLQLHNPILLQRGAGRPGARDVLDEVVPALERLRGQGKIRYLGLTALGDADALHQVIAGGAVDTAQVFYNLLNPSAGVEVPTGFPGDDFRGLLARARAAAVGVIAVRVLAGGALSGVESRHPIAAPSVAPIASGPSYSADVGRARALHALVDEGHAGSLVEAALRFTLASEAVSTVLLGCSDLRQLEYAAASVSKGPLPAVAMSRLAELWRRSASP